MSNQGNNGLPEHPMSMPTPPLNPQAASNPAAPPAPRKELEARAKQVIQDLNATLKAKAKEGGGSRGNGNEPSLPKRSPKVAGVIVFLLLLVGGGGFAGMQLLNQDQSADLGSQAAWTSTCSSAADVGKYSCYSYTQQAYCQGSGPCPSGYTGPNVNYPHWCLRDCGSGNYCVSGVGECRAAPTAVPTTPAGNPTATPANAPRYCNSNGCDVASHYATHCSVNHWHCPTRVASGQGCTQVLVRAGVRSSSFEKDCGTEQIDVTQGCPNDFYPQNNNLSDFTSRTYDRDCGPTPGPTNPPQPTPTTPIPTATPTTQPLACTTLGFSNSNPIYGETVTLTCTGNPNASVGYAYFQYSINGGAYQNVANATNTTGQLTINSVGTYNVRCRVCRSQDVATCTAWQTAGVN